MENIIKLMQLMQLPYDHNDGKRESIRKNPNKRFAAQFKFGMLSNNKSDEFHGFKNDLILDLLVGTEKKSVISFQSGNCKFEHEIIKPKMNIYCIDDPSKSMQYYENIPAGYNPDSKNYNNIPNEFKDSVLFIAWPEPNKNNSDLKCINDLGCEYVLIIIECPGAAGSTNLHEFIDMTLAGKTQYGIDKFYINETAIGQIELILLKKGLKNNTTEIFV